MEIKHTAMSRLVTNLVQVIGKSQLAAHSE